MSTGSGAFAAVPLNGQGYGVAPLPSDGTDTLPPVLAETGVQAVGDATGRGAGPAAAAGSDGRGIATSTIDAQGHLIVTYDDGVQQDAGRARGRDGIDGDDGKASAINATFTVSTAPPSGGNDGDVWFQINPY